MSHRVRPLVVAGDNPDDPCAHCDVRHRSVCSVIDDAHLARLAATAETMQVDSGVIFVNEGDPAASFFNVTAGTVKLFKQLPDGRQQITGFAGVGHFLGLAVSTEYAFSAEAIGPARLCRFSRRKLSALIDDFPALEHRLLETACNELATAQDRMLLLGRRTARERLACFILNRLEHAAPCTEVQTVSLPMTRGDIADFLGLTIETVSRNLSRFRADKRIALPALDTLTVLDRQWLEEVAAGG